MFWKKKDKGEDPKAKTPEPVRETARVAPPPSPQSSAPQNKNAGPGRAIDAALSGRHAPPGAPVSAESLVAQAQAADRLAQSGDGVDKQAAKDLAAGQFEKGLDALKGAAEKAGKDSKAADRWRTLGALAFNVDAGRAKWAYEHLFNFQPRQYWDCIFLARLRGLGGQLPDAAEAANAALQAAQNDVDRGVARNELGLIALASQNAADAKAHAEEALALGRRAGLGPGGQRELIGRLVLVGDAALISRDHGRARAVFAEALDLVRRDGQAAPSDVGIARAVCEVLEKSAAAATGASDHAAAKGFVEEALGMRRKLSGALPRPDGQRALAQTLSIKAEILRAAGDAAGAAAGYQECLGLLRQIGESAPRDASAQREVWLTMWRMATNKAGMDWRQVASSMEAMERNGALDDEGRKFLGEAKRRAAA